MFTLVILLYVTALIAFAVVLVKGCLVEQAIEI